LKEGNTIPFIARYRKEATGALDETQLRSVEQTWREIRELSDRKQTILATIEKLGKLTPELRRRIESCWDKLLLEDLYLPFKPKKHTRAETARKAGLEPLAMMILGRVPVEGRGFEIAQRFVDPGTGVNNADEALAGARDIVAEIVTSDPAVRSATREFALKSASIVSRRKRGSSDEAEAFKDYFAHEEPARRIPAHRFLAIVRGENQGALSLRISVDDARGQGIVKRGFAGSVPSLFRREFHEAVEDGWKRLLRPAVKRELLSIIKERSDRASVGVFEGNLRSLLMEPPARGRRVLGLDPGFRSGCKLACIDETGRVLGTSTIYPHPPQKRDRQAVHAILALAERHRLDVVAVGDGTAHRETMRLLKGASLPASVEVVGVREAGASVYSASPLAVEELPDLDVTLRGAVSIARRYQDPLAELVKIDPKSLGVGQYQHDVEQSLLAAGLEAVIQECVNRVGVEVNTASASLLEHVAGIGRGLAKNIVSRREGEGPFSSRQQLLDVSGMGPARFTQCAGFLRIPQGTCPLDRTGIHPEQYGFVAKVARTLGLEVADLIENSEAVRRLRDTPASGTEVGRETLHDILAELEKPGRDPRGEREEFRFAEGIETVDDLMPGMSLPGRVTSITDFGAFVDIGVHRDGLVHVSQMADRRVASPFEVCRPQQVVRVKVLNVDRKRCRISLTMKPSEVEEN